MPWQEVSTMSLRQEFITLVQHETVSMSELCRRYGVSRKTGYKWPGRSRREGPAGLSDRARRPRQSPRRTPADLEVALVALRQQHPAWGARKLRRRLQTLGRAPVPAYSTVTAILHRHGLIAPEGPGGRQPWVRFEHPVSNSLWQMDFKGPVRTLARRCHPLGILDDHSRVLASSRRASSRSRLLKSRSRWQCSWNRSSCAAVMAVLLPGPPRRHTRPAPGLLQRGRRPRVAVVALPGGAVAAAGSGRWPRGRVRGAAAPDAAPGVPYAQPRPTPGGG